MRSARRHPRYHSAVLDRLIVLAPATIEDGALESCRKLAQNLASATGDPVTLALDSRDLVREAAFADHAGHRPVQPPG